MPSQPLPVITGPAALHPTPDSLAIMLGTVAIETHGCKLNQADSAVLAEEFAKAGYRLVGSAADADVVVVNTCTVTATADAKARQALRGARRANPKAVVVAAGCYPERAARALREMPEVSLVVGNKEKPNLVSMVLDSLGSTRPTARPMPDESVTIASGVLRRSRAMVKIQEGCDQVCAYCIVPKVRGRERSIHPDVLVESVRGLVANGFKEVVLTGTQLGTYGFDIEGTNLPGLLDLILGETDLPRLRVSSLQAHEISADLLERWREPRVCPHFHVPLQSGCDTTLRAMRRRYDQRTFWQAVNLIRDSVLDAGITTDVIVGFPGESEPDHRASLEFAAEMQFADMHVFPYSRRPGTSANYFRDQVDAVAKRRRAAEMAELKDAAFNKYRQGLLGDVHSVLWETAKPVAAGDLRWSGLTENYVRVATVSPQDLGSRIAPARLTTIAGAVMEAELV